MGQLVYCSVCGEKNNLVDLDGTERSVCPKCGTVHYLNPIPASTIISVKYGTLLLVKRAVAPAIGEWCLPGGFMELGENPEDTAKRELKEETGLDAGSMDFLNFCPIPGGVKGGVMVMGFIASDVTGEIVAGDDAWDAKYFHLDSLPEIPFPCHRWFIERYLLEKTDKI